MEFNGFETQAFLSWVKHNFTDCLLTHMEWSAAEYLSEHLPIFCGWDKELFLHEMYTAFDGEIKPEEFEQFIF